ncbi:MAG: hypothetical protein JWQ11_4145 [Rhizobacter sp.]|nr:hypothetical protein [Rhizobacter sp.]
MTDHEHEIHQVAVSGILSVPIDHAWQRIRDFHDIAAWSYGTTIVAVEGDGLAAGATRTVKSAVGVFVERCDSVDTTAHRVRYRIETSPWALRRYEAEVQLAALQDDGRETGVEATDRCRVHWSCSLILGDRSPPGLVRAVERMYRRFIVNLQANLLADRDR